MEKVMKKLLTDKTARDEAEIKAYAVAEGPGEYFPWLS
jgi:hypothetical protein